MEVIYNRPKLASYQSAIINSKARYTVTEAATKVGKTASHIVWLFEQALQGKPNSNYWWVAPTYTQAEIAFKRLKNQLSERTFITCNETKLSITLITKQAIHFKSAEKPDNLYGEDVYAAVFDEFTRAREEAWHALRSTLTATNGPCKFIGNVKGKKNWGYRLALKAKAGEPNFEYFKITAYDAVKEGILTFDEVQQAKRDLPEYVFNELYLAEANEDGSNPFGLSHIRASIKPISTNPVAVYGIDLAKSTDYTVIIGLDEDGNICYFDRFQKDWKQTREGILRVIGDTQTAIDCTGVGDPIVEDLQRESGNIEGFRFTQLSKQQIMEGLASAIQQSKTSVLTGIHQDELESFEFEYTRTGVKYCVSLDTMILTSDLKWKKAEDLTISDKLIGFDEYPINENKTRTFKNSEILELNKIIKPCYEIIMSNGDKLISSEDHLWLIDTGNTTKTGGKLEWRRTDKLRGENKTNSLRYCPNKIVKIFNIWNENIEYESGYLSGIFDGEGSFQQGQRTDHKGSNFRISFSQRKNKANEFALSCLEKYNFKYSVYEGGGTNNDVDSISLTGRKYETLRFLGQIRPKRFLNKFNCEYLGTLEWKRMSIKSVTFIGNAEVLAMVTSTKTFIANGYASHNCAPSGLHDDTVCAHAIAWHKLNFRRGWDSVMV